MSGASLIAPQQKLLQHLDRLHELKTTGTTAPLNAEVDLSNRCSLGCDWCHFAYTHTRGPLKGTAKPEGAIAGGDLMATSLAMDLVRQLADYGVYSVTWTGGGEPTLHPDFDEIVEYTAGRLEQGIYTHGGHINQARSELLKKHFTFVYVSLDAADRETYAASKGVDRFDAACTGIRLLAGADGPAAVGVGYLVHAKNYKDIPRAAELAQTLGADYLQLRPVIRYETKDPAKRAEDTAWVTPALDVINKAAYYHPNILVDPDRFRMYRDWQGHDYTQCFWSMLQTVVTPNGKVWTCVNRREHPSALIGDLLEEPFASIWARHTVAQVGPDCRILCRGHLPNLTLTEVMTERPHASFV